MGLSFLDLPREIRDMIYYYVLVSPSHCVLLNNTSHARCLFAVSSTNSSTRLSAAVPTPAPTTSYPNTAHILPWDPRYRIPIESCLGSRTISLAILRTCKNINAECKDIFWRENTLVLCPRGHYMFDTAKRIDGVQTLAMHFDLTTSIDNNYNEDHISVDLVEKWSQAKSVQKMTVFLYNEGAGDTMEACIRTFMEGGEDLPQGLRRHGIFSLAYRAYRRQERIHLHSISIWSRFLEARNIEKNLIVSTNFPYLDEQDREKFINDAAMDPNELIKEIHQSFRSHLWVDGTKCFDYLEQIAKAFTVDPRDVVQKSPGLSSNGRLARWMARPYDIPERI